jgi:hypothetical protein
MLGLLLSASTLTGCASSDDNNNDSHAPPDEWILGGQTGSLIPGCGVAPLSEAGRAVPTGDVLAVLYTSRCPGGSAPELALTGPDALPIGVTLEPLEGSGVYLVRADQSLSMGEHQLELPGTSSSTLAIGDAASPLPARLGRLSPIDDSSDCGDVRFEWELTEEALAHAALLRLWIRVDAGREQLWVDYGALELETAAGNRGLLRLPRCGQAGCLEAGVHGLEMRAELAGETLQPESLQTSFEVQCPDALSSADTRDLGADSAAACSVTSTARTTASRIGVYWMLGWAVFSRRRARNPAR